MRRIPLVSAVWRARNGQKIDNQQRDADVDRRIGEIEDEKMPAKGVKIEKVHDGAMNNAVERVAERAADDRPSAGGQSGSRSGEPPAEQAVAGESEPRRSGRR